MLGIGVFLFLTNQILFAKMGVIPKNGKFKFWKGGEVDISLKRFEIGDSAGEERDVTIENLKVCPEGQEGVRVRDVMVKVCNFFGTVISARGVEGAEKFLRREVKVRLSDGPTLNTEDILIKRKEG